MRNLRDQRDVVPERSTAEAEPYWLESPRDSVDNFLNFQVFIFSLTFGVCIYKGYDKIELCSVTSGGQCLIYLYM